MRPDPEDLRAVRMPALAFREIDRKHCERLRAQLRPTTEELSKGQTLPPTDELLDLVWRHWHALPARLGPHEREIRLRAQLEPRFWTSVGLACRWVEMVKFASTGASAFRVVVERRMRAPGQLDAHAVARVASNRAREELNVSCPGLMFKKAPSVKEIDLWCKRTRVYQAARLRAQRSLSRLLYAVPGVRLGTPVPWRRRARGFPRPPSDVPRYFHFARLEALGLCSRDGVRRYFSEEFHTLSHVERMAFYKAATAGIPGKDPYPVLRVWIIDNRPVFDHFEWRWADVHTAAKARNLAVPEGGHNNLKQWALRQGVRLKMRAGIPPASQRSEVQRSERLLSPAPSLHIAR